MSSFQALRAASVIALCSLGCASPCGTTTGWNFSVGKPATMSAAAAVAQGPGAMALYPVGAFPQASMRGAALAAEAPGCLPPAGGSLAASGGLAAMGPPCDLQDVCRRLERIEQRLGNSTPLPRPLPAGPASGQ